ncbi:MAG: metallophosphoesterase [Actinomycetota bacterium]
MIRVAAAGDLHFGTDSAGSLREPLADLPSHADILLLAGDLTRRGEPAEARVLADELGGLEIPVVSVLGNHDYESDREEEITKILTEAGVTVLEGESTVVDVHGERLGVAGLKGFGGGFAGACASDFGEPEMKAFIRHTQDGARRLSAALEDLEGVDVRVALLHYSPIRETLQGEPLEIFPFLGSYLLAEAVDDPGADLVLHGHAHRGVEKGVTPGGVRVRNVAQHVIGRAYNIYELNCEPDC